METAVKVLSNFAVDRAFTMEAVKEIRIVDHLDNNWGITFEQAEPIYEMIIKAFNAGQHVVLDFEGVELVTGGFLYQLIGKLYEDYASDQLKGMLAFIHLSSSVAASVKRMEEQMIFYLANPDLYNKIMEDAIYGSI